MPPRLVALYHRQDPSSGCTLQAETVFPTPQVAEYGAPARMLMEVKIPSATGSRPGDIHAALRVFNKTTTRRPEAMWLRMQPQVASPRILLNKLGASCAGCDEGSWIDAMSVVRNGSQRVHAVSDLGVRVVGGDSVAASFVSLDSALVRVGQQLSPLRTCTSVFPHYSHAPLVLTEAAAQRCRAQSRRWALASLTTCGTMHGAPTT